MPESLPSQRRLPRILRPQTRVGKVALWSGLLAAVFLSLHASFDGHRDTPLHAVASLSIQVFLVCAIWLLIRRFRRIVILWKLRNRLAVAYVLIGVFPVVLLLLMGSIGGYMFAGQFATYIALSDLQARVQQLQGANDAAAAQCKMLYRAGTLSAVTAAAPIADAFKDFPQGEITVRQNTTGFGLDAQGRPLPLSPGPLPAGIAPDFHGIVLDQDTLHLRVVKRYADTGLTIVASVPLTQQLLLPTAARLGEITVIPPFRSGGLELPPSPDNPAARVSIAAGKVPPPTNFFDRSFRFYTVFPVVHWHTGKSSNGGIGVLTRPSLLYNILFATLGNRAWLIRNVLLGLAIFFGIIELVALFIALLLSRRITGSVSKLYTATQFVNRGDLTHTIKVRHRDQMATLEESFNSMTASLVDLLAEQKEKQRLESELTIAREVQDLLFPHDFSGVPSLEVYGLCRPARSVSGDYYDFIPLGADRLALLIGDISGKGISAALLMATLHAFVRAYALEPEVLPPQTGDGSGMYYRGGAALRPCTLMTTLNYQLFRCTPPEKYATMFLGCYDAATRELTYCNAGHLPPIVLHQNGTLSRLTACGTVAGLFDDSTYTEATIRLEPGDLLLAFSDGVTEPERDNVEFGEARLLELLRLHRDQPLASIGTAITDAIEAWIGSAELPDDLTVILARPV